MSLPEEGQTGHPSSRFRALSATALMLLPGRNAAGQETAPYRQGEAEPAANLASLPTMSELTPQQPGETAGLKKAMNG